MLDNLWALHPPDNFAGTTNTVTDSHFGRSGGFIKKIVPPS